MEKILEHVLSLAGESKKQKRYECKVTSTKLNLHPYIISLWTEDPSTIPDVKLSIDTIFSIRRIQYL